MAKVIMNPCKKKLPDPLYSSKNKCFCPANANVLKLIKRNTNSGVGRFVLEKMFLYADELPYGY